MFLVLLRFAYSVLISVWHFPGAEKAAILFLICLSLARPWMDKEDTDVMKWEATLGNGGQGQKKTWEYIPPYLHPSLEAKILNSCVYGRRMSQQSLLRSWGIN